MSFFFFFPSQIFLLTDRIRKTCGILSPLHMTRARRKERQHSRSLKVHLGNPAPSSTTHIQQDFRRQLKCFHAWVTR